MFLAILHSVCHIVNFISCAPSLVGQSGCTFTILITMYFVAQLSYRTDCCSRERAMMVLKLLYYECPDKLTFACSCILLADEEPTQVVEFIAAPKMKFTIQNSTSRLPVQLLDWCGIPASLRRDV